MRPKNLNKLITKDRQVLICRGTGCESQKAKAIYTALEAEVNKNGLAKKIEVKFTGCHGFCQQGPTVMIEPEGTFYCQVTPEDVTEIVDSDLKNGDIVERLLFVDKKSKPKKPVHNYQDIDYFKPQQRVVLRNCGFINPEDIDDYLKIGGYEVE